MERQAVSGLYSKDDFCPASAVGWRNGGRGVAPAVLLMRIDNFSGLSTRFGPDIPDLVLHRRAVPCRFDPCHGLGARYDETSFGMLLPGANTVELIRVAERLRQAIARCLLPIEAHAVQFTVSLGCDGDPDRRRGNDAGPRKRRLQQAEAAGGNRTFFHNGQLAEPAQATIERMRAVATV